MEWSILPCLTFTIYTEKSKAYTTLKTRPRHCRCPVAKPGHKLACDSKLHDLNGSPFPESLELQLGAGLLIHQNHLMGAVSIHNPNVRSGIHKLGRDGNEVFSFSTSAKFIFSQSFFMHSSHM